MLQKFIAKNISFPLQDYINKTNILDTFCFLNKTQHWSIDKIQDYQFEKFLKLLHHSILHVPYYKELFRKNRLTLTDIREPSDIQKIPILTKHVARLEREKLIAVNHQSKKVFKGITGGTTGPPLRLLRDVQDISFTWGAFYRWYNWMNIDIGDRMTKIWGTSTVLKKSSFKNYHDYLKNFYYNRQHINSFNLNKETLPLVIKKINRFKPELIRGYLSALFQIAEYINKNQIFGLHEPKAISSTTETLLPPFKNLIEQTFKTKLYDQYGCGECNSIAFEAGDENGLYVAMEHALLEILDEKDKATNSDGRIIVTNLDNFIMPFIRYENGDISCWGEKQNKTNINLPTIKRISGRIADTIVLKDGSKVHGVFFTDILNDLFKVQPEFIHRFQVFQAKAGEIEFRVESNFQLNKNYEEQLYNALFDYFNRVKIATYPILPKDKSGKFRYIISENFNDENNLLQN